MCCVHLLHACKHTWEVLPPSLPIFFPPRQFYSTIECTTKNNEEDGQKQQANNQQLFHHIASKISNIKNTTTFEHVCY